MVNITALHEPCCPEILSETPNGILIRAHGTLIDLLMKIYLMINLVNIYFGIINVCTFYIDFVKFKLV